MCLYCKSLVSDRLHPCHPLSQNIFARGLGGYLSDKANAKLKMRGRILVQAALLILEGVCIFVFAEMGHLAASVVMLTIFSIFVQGAEGSTYGIVPYVNRVAPGAVAGIVGAGGPTGAVSFGLVFRQLPDDPEKAFRIMGGVVLASGIMSVLINIKGHRGLLFGKDVDLGGKIQLPVGEDLELAEDDEAKAAGAEGAATNDEGGAEGEAPKTEACAEGTESQ